jgi:hypothetical protein
MDSRKFRGAETEGEATAEAGLPIADSFHVRLQGNSEVAESQAQHASGQNTVGRLFHCMGLWVRLDAVGGFQGRDKGPTQSTSPPALAAHSRTACPENPTNPPLGFLSVALPSFSRTTQNKHYKPRNTLFQYFPLVFFNS